MRSLSWYHGVAAVLGLTLAVLSLLPDSAKPAAAQPPPPPTFIMDPEPVYKPTGGPYIHTGEALRIALQRARPTVAGKDPGPPPVDRAIGLLTYGDVVSWSGGSRTYTIALGREVYLVVMATMYTPQRVTGGPPKVCNWVAVVVDASDGTPRALHCGPEPWPLRLPVGVTRVP